MNIFEVIKRQFFAHFYFLSLSGNFKATKRSHPPYIRLGQITDLEVVERIRILGQVKPIVESFLNTIYKIVLFHEDN